MKRFIIVLLAVLWLVLPSPASAIDGFPGSTWGDLHWESPHPGENDVVLSGWVRQGIGWKRWEIGGDMSLTLDTYATVRYYADTHGFDWFNYFGPGGGVSLDLSAPHGPSVSAGAEYIHQMNFRSSTERPYAALYLNWYHWWDLHEKDYPGATWGDLRWEVPTNGGNDNLILEGWVKQGIVLKRWETGSTTYFIDPYVRVRYKYDSLGQNWNNYIGPGAGIALEIEKPDGPLVSFGAEYGWERDWKSGNDVNRIEVYMRWYAWWDLKKK